MLIVCVPLLQVRHILGEVDAVGFIYVDERVGINNWAKFFLVVFRLYVPNLHPYADQELCVYSLTVLFCLPKAVVVLHNHLKVFIYSAVEGFCWRKTEIH